jgi:hypothetical protein
VLAAAAGGAAAVATALLRPDGAAAAVGDPVRAGMTTSAGGKSTALKNSSSTRHTLVLLQDGSSTALRAVSKLGHGARFVAQHQNRNGLYASNSANSPGSGAAIRAAGGQNTGLKASGGFTAIDAHGETVGGWFVSEAIAGVGVRGEAKAGSGSTVGVWGVSNSTAGFGVFSTGKLGTNEFLELNEIATPIAPSSLRARLFVRDVAGKGQLCVRFPTGAVQVIATEP